MPVEFKSPARRGTPGGNSTFDLFSWHDGTDGPQTRPPVRVSATNDSNAFASVNDSQAACASPVGRPTIRMQQPAGGVSHITFGEGITQDEAEALLKSFRRPGSETKRREMSGSGIFAADSADGIEAAGAYTPSVRLSHQPAGGASQISFGGDEAISPKKPTSIPEVAKQRELSGNLETQAEIHRGKHLSNNKAKELVGSNIFGPPPVDVPRSVNRNPETRDEAKGHDAPLRNVHTSVKVSNPAGGRSQISFGAEETDYLAKKVHDQKLAELSGSNIFKDGKPPMSVEKALSSAKLREMTGSDIFADEKPSPRDSIGGIRKPPEKSTSEGFYSRPLAKHTSERKFKEMKGSEIQTVFDQRPLSRDCNPIPSTRKPQGKGTSASSAKLKEMMGSGIFPDQASVWQNIISRNAGAT